MTQALADRSERTDELLASGLQADMIFKHGQRALSLRASKLWHMLVKASGTDLAANKDHKILLADLYQEGLGHMTLAERVDALRELQTTLIEVRVPSPKVKGRIRIISEALLGKVERDEDDRGELVWRFGETLRRVFADSPNWAVLSKRAVMAFESRYSLRLYEIIALRVNLDYIHSETFALEDLRARLGVPVGKLDRWDHLRSRALEPAIAEVNQLAGFSVRYETVKRGRSVAAVRLHWAKKSGPALSGTKRELDGSKVGRKARRDSAVEMIAEPEIEFPTGSIRHTPFAAIAFSNLPQPYRDLDLVADDFRAWAKRGKKPLRGDQVTPIFAGFCRKQKPAF